MKRFTTIVLAVGMLTISVSVFADSDGGRIIKTWYDNAFSQAVDETAAEFLNQIVGMDRALSSEKRVKTSEARDELGILVEEKTEYSIKEVSNYQQHYIKVARDTKQVLMDKNLSELKDGEISKVESELETEVGAILAEVLP